MQVSEVRCDLFKTEGRAGREGRGLLMGILCTAQHLHGQRLCMHGHRNLQPKLIVKEGLLFRTSGDVRGRHGHYWGSQYHACLDNAVIQSTGTSAQQQSLHTGKRI